VQVIMADEKKIDPGTLAGFSPCRQISKNIYQFNDLVMMGQ